MTRADGSCTLPWLATLAAAALAALAPAVGGAEVEVWWEGDIPIPDIIEPPGISVEIEVEPHPSGEHTILDVDLGFHIPHTWQGDLIIALEHVDTGTFVEVLNRPGSPERSPWGFFEDDYGAPGDHFVSDDEADLVYDVPDVEWPGIPAVTGPWKPEADPLARFDGESIVGTWRFWVGDKGGGDIGTIREISLRFRTTTCVGDVDRDGTVDLRDLLALLAAWGACPPECPPDTNDDGTIDLADLLALLAAWGPC